MTFELNWFTSPVPFEEVRFGPGDMRGRLYSPRRLLDGRGPAVVLGADISSGRDHDLARYADWFARAGFLSLAFDYRGSGAPGARGLGSQGGDSRLVPNPTGQIETFRSALAFVRRLPNVDAERAGAWGIGLDAGHVIALGAHETELAAAVCVAPLVSARNTLRSMITGGVQMSVSEHALAQRHQGAGRLEESFSDPLASLPSFDPIRCAPLVQAPTLMLAAADDELCSIDLQALVYQLLPQPRRLRVLDGDHFSFSGDNLQSAANLSTAWFIEHLHDQDEANARGDLLNAIF